MYSNSISILNVCSSVDWLIFATSLIITLISVFAGKKASKKLLTSNISKQKLNFIEYLVMGRKLTLPLFIATLVATWYGNIFGVAQIAFEHGIYNFVTQGAFWYISYLIFACYLVKKIRNSQALTLPELITNVIGPKSGSLSCILIFIKTLPISLAISLGIFLQLIFPINFYLATFLGVVFILIYSSTGGLRNIVFSDAVQFVLMYLGTAAVMVFSYFEFGGLSYLKNNLPSSYFNPTGDYSWSYTLVWFFIAITTTFVNPTFYQRCFAAENYKVARNGILFAVVIWFLFDICLTLGGMYAKAAIPNADPSNGYLVYALQILPNGFRGLLLASILATILSTLDSFIFLASNIISYDLKLKISKNFHVKHLISITIVAAITLVGAYLIEGKIETIWRTFRGYFASCLIMPLIATCTIKLLTKKYKLNYKISYETLNNLKNKLDINLVTSCITGIIIVTLYDFASTNINTINFKIDSFYIGTISTTLTVLALNFCTSIKEKTVNKHTLCNK